MTKIVHPYSHRLGIIKDWKSRWFSLNSDFRRNLKGDILMREWITKNLKNQYIGLVEIERNSKVITIAKNNFKQKLFSFYSSHSVLAYAC